MNNTILKNNILKDLIQSKGNPTIHNLNVHKKLGHSEDEVKQYLHSTLTVYSKLNNVEVSKELSDEVYEYLKEQKYLNDINFNDLNIGDKILTRGHKIYEFIELKRTNFVGRLDGQNYNVPLLNAIEVVEKAKPKERFDVNTFKKNQLFYINHKNSAELYYFKEIKGNNVVGINPITKGNTTIPKSFDFYPLDVVNI